jgi:glycosyltransferase involved in cell wall biosynthesis
VKVIHVSPVYVPAWQYGGTVRAIHGMTTALVAKGHEVEVVTTTIGTPYGASHEVHKAVVDDVRVTYVPGKVCWGGAVAPQLAGEVIRRATEDSAIHISSGWQPAFRRMFASLRRSARPYAYSPHGCFSPEVFAKGRVKKGIYYRLFERCHLRNAALVLATSEMEAVDLRRLDSSLSVSVVPNACDASLWRPVEAEGFAWRHSLAIADDDIVILQVCRPDPIKNTNLLVDALRQIAACRNYVLVVMGPGQSRLPVEKALPSHVRVIRHEGSNEISELRAAYSAADVVAVPSLYECFGNVVVEAILCGTPVIAGPRVGAAYLPDSAAAVTVLPLRVDAWTHAIRAWPKYEKVSKETIFKTASAVAPSRIAKQLGDIYASIGTGSEGPYRSRTLALR